MDTLEYPPIEESLTPPASVANLTPAASAAVDLAKISLTDVALAQFGDWRKEAASVTKQLTGLVLDLSTPTKITDAKSLRQRLINAPLADARKVAKAVKSKLNTVSGEVGAELVLIETAYTEADKLISPQIEAREAEIERDRLENIRLNEERVKAILTKIQNIKDCVAKAQAPDMTSDRITMGVALVEAIQITKDVYEEFLGEAEQAKSTTVAIMLNLRDQAKSREEAAARLEAQRLENERIAAEQAKERERLAAQQKALDEQAAALAAQQKQADEARAAREREEADALAARQSEATQALAVQQSEQNFEGQASQQVLKAEPATADATDRDVPASSSPSVGSMGAGQVADAAPVVQAGPGLTNQEELAQLASQSTTTPEVTGPAPTMTVGQIQALIAPVSINSEGITSLGFEKQVRPGQPGSHFLVSDLPKLFRAIAKRAETAAEALEAA